MRSFLSPKRIEAPLLQESGGFVASGQLIQNIEDSAGMSRLMLKSAKRASLT